MQVYYYSNRKRKEELNKNGLDYTSAYIPEILSLLGVTAQPLDTVELTSGVLTEDDILFTGNEALPDGFCFGGVHIAFGTAGDLSGFGLERLGETAKEGGKYGIDGYCRLEMNGQMCRVPIFSAFTLVEPKEAKTLAYAETDSESLLPVIFKNCSKTYFAFDLPATVWKAGDGIPTNEGQNGFNLGRVPDGRPIPLTYDTRVAYTDCLIYIIQDTLYSCGVPMIHRLPPMDDGKAPDFLLYFTGDDDADSTENNMKAAAVMMKKGLPYHINAMPADTEGRFVIDRDQHDGLVRGGCEVAIHPNFLGISEYSQEGYRIQAEMFERAFGQPSVTTVNHCLVQHGSCAQRLRYEENIGILGDNNKMGETDPDDVNAFNMCGFAFGTAFPRYTLDDAEHGNARIDVVEIPVTYYEPRIFTGSDEEKKKIHDYLDQCAFWGRTGGFFLHPHYISGVLRDAAPAIAALDEAMAYIALKGYNVYTTAPDALTLWWRDRAKSRISQVSSEGFTLECTADALILRLPSGTASVMLDGKITNTAEKKLDDGVYTLLTVNGRGKHTITYIK